MRETMLDKLQNKCCICGKTLSDTRVKITHEARSRVYADYNRYNFTCMACAQSVEEYMQEMRDCFITGGNKDD